MHTTWLLILTVGLSGTAVVSWHVREWADGLVSDYLGEKSKVIHCRNYAVVGGKGVDALHVHLTVLEFRDMNSELMVSAPKQPNLF